MDKQARNVCEGRTGQARGQDGAFPEPCPEADAFMDAVCAFLNETEQEEAKLQLRTFMVGMTKASDGERRIIALAMRNKRAVDIAQECGISRQRVNTILGKLAAKGVPIRAALGDVLAKQEKRPGTPPEHDIGF